ncbi:MAG: DMT family transporter, partial [Ferruginibacter sp.]
FHPQYKLGIIFGIISAMGSALFPVFNKELLKRFTPRVLTLYELGGGAVMLTLLLPLYLINFNAVYFIPTIPDLLWLLVLAGLCTVVSFDLQLNALKRLSAFTANLTYNLEPIYGIILAFIFFDEGKMFKPGFYLGLSLILLAIALHMWRLKRMPTHK